MILKSPFSIARRAGSSPGARSNSSATKREITDCLGRRTNNSTCPTRANAITGDALITHLSATPDFFDDFISAVLERRNFVLV